ncbi:MAG: hypothetical protein O2999_01970 [Nitrospirae bacterium]|nr:hypothetical protein [Nitrospirota bacterium]MDA1303068.1 hypothetical protein [Nitrospirota bacterium]
MIAFRLAWDDGMRISICASHTPHAKDMDWTVYGLHGSITTQEECHAVDGRWFPQVYGWMIHIFPFADSPEKIWTH